MLSVGLIPENELSKNSGLELDRITNGPRVDEYRETEHAGVFACGNVLQVHDLVDYVTEESQIAGLGAAKYIKGEKVTSECVYTQGINGVRYIVPQRINRATDTDVKLYFRVGAVFNNARIIVECDGKEILSKKKVKLCPGEMEYVTLKQSVIAELPAEAVINVRVEA